MRTPEEEAAYWQSRCAAKREYDRRRRADPAQRAKEAAAKRRRRAEDPEYARREKARERQRKRAVREVDPGFRAAENERRRARESVRGASVSLSSLAYTLCLNFLGQS